MIELESLWRPLVRYSGVVRDWFGYALLGQGAKVLPWSRFCPACLKVTGGRWQAAWRLPWWVACPLHGTLLVSACPVCGGHQRRHPIHRELDVPETTTCSVPRPGARGRGNHPCGHKLTGDAARRPASSEILGVQGRLAALLDAAAPDESLAAALGHLADLLTIASVRGVNMALITTGSTGTASLAGALAEAEDVLSEPSERTLVELVSADVVQRPSPLPRAWRSASPTLVSRILAIRDARLSPTVRLRWRTTTVGRVPSDDGTREALRRWTPDGLWPDWSVRLCPPGGVDVASFRRVAAACLQLPGATAPLVQLVAGWRDEERPSGGLSFHVLYTVAADDRGRAVLQALTQLADNLRAHGSPIDYERRRRIGRCTDLLDEATWDRICAAAGTPTGGHRKLKAARQWVWETLTGGLVQNAPGILRPEERGGVSGFHDFALYLPQLAAGLLDAHARRVLDEAGCADEPLTWSPPPTWVDLSGLPGP
ncbi:MAG TPA: TniQ family protein, partial [Actinomycetota bacterium]